MNFDMIALNQNIKTNQNYATWILTALLFILKLKIFTNNVEKWFENQTTAKMIIDR